MRHGARGRASHDREVADDCAREAELAAALAAARDRRARGGAGARLPTPLVALVAIAAYYALTWFVAGRGRLVAAGAVPAFWPSSSCVTVVARGALDVVGGRRRRRPRAARRREWAPSARTRLLLISRHSEYCQSALFPHWNAWLTETYGIVLYMRRPRCRSLLFSPAYTNALAFTSSAGPQKPPSRRRRGGRVFVARTSPIGLRGLEDAGVDTAAVAEAAFSPGMFWRSRRSQAGDGTRGLDGAAPRRRRRPIWEFRSSPRTTCGAGPGNLPAELLGGGVDSLGIDDAELALVAYVTSAHLLCGIAVALDALAGDEIEGLTLDHGCGGASAAERDDAGDRVCVTHLPIPRLLVEVVRVGDSEAAVQGEGRHRESLQSEGQSSKPGRHEVEELDAVETERGADEETAFVDEAA